MGWPKSSGGKSICAVIKVMPVALPPGLLKLATNPGGDRIKRHEDDWD